MAIVSTCEKLFSKKVVCRADGTNITFTPAASYQKAPKFATENVAKKPNEPKVATRSQKVSKVGKKLPFCPFVLLYWTRL